MVIGDKKFERHCDLIDVTRMSRPDPAWRFVDPSGHEHRWHVVSGDGTKPADGYRPNERYVIPSTVKVLDEPYYTEEGDEIEQSHLECLLCRARVKPGTRCDDTPQYIAGLTYYSIDGRTVDPETFERELKALM